MHWAFDLNLEADCKCLCEANHGSTEGCDFFDAPCCLVDEDDPVVGVNLCRYCADLVPVLYKVLRDLVRVLRC